MVRRRQDRHRAPRERHRTRTAAGYTARTPHTPSTGEEFQTFEGGEKRERNGLVVRVPGWPPERHSRPRPSINPPRYLVACIAWAAESGKGARLCRAFCPNDGRFLSFFFTGGGVRPALAMLNSRVPNPSNKARKEQARQTQNATLHGEHGGQTQAFTAQQGDKQLHTLHTRG